MICFLAFDHRINCFDPIQIDESNKKFVRTIDDFMELSGVLSYGLPLWKLGIKTKKLKEFLEVHDYIVK